tara:strand:- start:17 stop:295 length:279 start_codon:yes stop_codon:yes gene_type:complete
MQFKSNCESIVVDYHQIKNYKNEVNTRVRLKVVTFLGKTLDKTCIEVHDMAGEIDLLLGRNYAVTINTKRPAQLVPVHKVAQCIKHYELETV